jgi:hypothetical protein
VINVTLHIIKQISKCDYLHVSPRLRAHVRNVFLIRFLTIFGIGNDDIDGDYDDDENNNNNNNNNNKPQNYTWSILYCYVTEEIILNYR